MSSDWTLTKNDDGEHETLATCKSRTDMLQAIQRHEDIAYMCYVTETFYGHEGDFDGTGEIIEQENAQEWMEWELQRYETETIAVEEKPKPVKHSVKKYKFDDGQIADGMYIYRGWEFCRNEDVPTGYHNRYQIFPGGSGFVTLRELKAYIDSRLVNVLSEDNSK